MYDPAIIFCYQLSPNILQSTYNFVYALLVWRVSLLSISPSDSFGRVSLFVSCVLFLSGTKQYFLSRFSHFFLSKIGDILMDNARATEFNWAVTVKLLRSWIKSFLLSGDFFTRKNKNEKLKMHFWCFFVRDKAFKCYFFLKEYLFSSFIIFKCRNVLLWIIYRVFLLNDFHKLMWQIYWMEIFFLALIYFYSWKD